MTKGITEDGFSDGGFDLHEEQVRQEFEEYAIRKGYAISRHYNNPWEYYDSELENLWRAYHLGHVRGREFNEN